MSRHFTLFHQPVFALLQSAGWRVEACARKDSDLPRPCDAFHDLPFARSPFSPRNIKVFFALRRLIRRGGYDVLHCHTPVGGLLCRLAARGSGAKVIYTAHGFHFYKGAPPPRWLLYYPIEAWLARKTDVLLAINDEDFRFAQTHLHAKQVRRVHGVGCDITRFFPAEAAKKQSVRKALGLAEDAPVLVYAAECNKNKNQALLLRALPAILEAFPQTVLLLAGDGPLRDKLCARAQKSPALRESVRFLGACANIPDLLAAADAAVASSLREGLPLNVLEAMACALPVVALDNRGHRELIQNGGTGYLTHSAEELARRVIELLGNPALRAQMGRAGRARCLEYYAQERVLEELKEVYGL